MAISELLDIFSSGSVQALSKVISLVENEKKDAMEALEKYGPHPPDLIPWELDRMIPSWVLGVSVSVAESGWPPEEKASANKCPGSFHDRRSRSLKKRKSGEQV